MTNLEVLDEMRRNRGLDADNPCNWPQEERLQLASNWAFCKNRIEKRSDGYWYVKDDEQNVAFLGTYNTGECKDFVDKDKKVVIFPITRFVPVKLYEHTRLFSKPYSNPYCYKYVRDYTEEEKLKIETEYNVLGLKPNVLMKTKWTDEVPTNETVKKMWDLAWKEKFQARYEREAIEAAQKEKALAELGPKENIKHTLWNLD